MLEHYFTKPETTDRIRKSWIGEPIEKYVIWLSNQGYAARCSDEVQKIRFQKFVNRSLQTNKLIQILKDAEIFQEIQVSKDRFDQDPTLLAVPNGIIDLKSGKLRASEPSDYITRIGATEFHPDSTCPEFEKFILAIAHGSEKLKEFLLYLLGYCLTGLTLEQKIYFLFGNGSNGKTVFLEIIRSVIGSELVLQADSKTLVKNGRTIREDVARFSGARLATCSEIGEKDVLVEALLKGLSGGDCQVSRKLYQNSVEFYNQAKIIIATNIFPDLEGTDFGIERRIVVIRFTKQFIGKDVDATLKESLLKEKEGIMALLVKYSQKYLAEGMPETPEDVSKATSEYIKSGNSVRCFVEDCYGDSKDTSQESTLRSVYETYIEYCKRNSYSAIGSRNFTRLMKLMGYEQRKTGSRHLWSGLEVNLNKDTDNTSAKSTTSAECSRESGGEPLINEVESTVYDEKDLQGTQNRVDGVGGSPMLPEESQESKNSKENSSLQHSPEGDTDAND